MNRWFAVARGTEVPRRHVGHYLLLGQELAVWRSDSGAINAWENRCPHRGVRLTLGSCEGEELRCRYHAWRFASVSGQCTLIPAHPGQKPASTVRVRVFAAVEHDGFIWVNLAQGESPTAPTRVAHVLDSTRSIFVDAPLYAVRETLLDGYPVDSTASRLAVWSKDAYCLSAGNPDHAALVTFLLQPVTDFQTVIHGALHTTVEETARLARLRRHNAAMGTVRDEAERRAAAATGGGATA